MRTFNPIGLYCYTWAQKMSLPTKSAQTIALLTYGESDARKAHQCNQLTRPTVDLTNPRGCLPTLRKIASTLTSSTKGLKKGLTHFNDTWPLKHSLIVRRCGTIRPFAGFWLLGSLESTSIRDLYQSYNFQKNFSDVR